MDFSYVLAGALALTLVALLALRSRSTKTKLACEAALLIFLGGCLMARGSSPLPTRAILQAGDGGWLRALAVVWWLIGARLVATLTVLALGWDARSRSATLLSDLLAAAIYVTAILIILNSVLDLRVNGLIATSGVAAIVFGLALQNTLGDVFSGIAVGLEKPFHIGDRITILDHAEGRVVQMNWRSVAIETDGEDLATIPNSIVAKSQIINRSVPTERRAASLEIPTLSSERAERLMELIRQAVLLCPAILTEPVPVISIKSFGTRITTFGVAYHVATTPLLGTARSQLLRQVRRMFRYAGVPGGEAPDTSDLLADLVIFDSLNADQIADLAAALVPHRFRPGERVFEQGREGLSLYVIGSGVCEIAQTGQGGGTNLFGRVGPGEYLGELSMMTGEPHPVYMEAITNAVVHELPQAALSSLLSQDTGLSSAIESSVQRGLALLDRDDAARLCQPLDAGGSLLTRVRSFLRHAR